MTKILLLACSLCFSCASMPKSSPQSEEWIKGGVVTGISVERNCFFKPFVKTGDAEDDDYGERQIIGYTPGEVAIKRDGSDVIFERVRESRFVPLGSVKFIDGAVCKCPPFNE